MSVLYKIYFVTIICSICAAFYRALCDYSFELNIENPLQIFVSNNFRIQIKIFKKCNMFALEYFTYKGRKLRNVLSIYKKKVLYKNEIETFLLELKFHYSLHFSSEENH